MAEKTAAKKVAKGSASKFSADERAAMRARAKEAKGSGLDDLLGKISEMPKAEGALAKKVHDTITKAAPDLEPRTWYGMPAYSKDGKVLCFYRNPSKFKSRYGTFGFSDVARLDSGAMWATDFAILEWNTSVERQIRELVTKAVG